jgi:hypothetical protein
MDGFIGRRKRGRERAHQLQALGDCPDCRHPWVEHPGTGNDLDGMCGECASEFEHQQRESAEPGCRLRCPPLH